MSCLEEYGLVQSARQFYVKIVKALKSCGFARSLVDPYLWVKLSNTGIVIMAIYVDDCLTIGSDEGIKGVIKVMKKHDFGPKIEEDLKEYLSCHIKNDKEDGCAWIQ
jgi:hypothetical protein